MHRRHQRVGTDPTEPQAAKATLADVEERTSGLTSGFVWLCVGLLVAVLWVTAEIDSGMERLQRPEPANYVPQAAAQHVWPHA